MTAFVILHYRAIDTTRSCVKSIRALAGDKHIVIVDNASPNGTGAVLAEEFAASPDVTVLLHGKNDGFARGNNVGTRWVYEHLDADFTVVLNNDVEIPQHDFIPQIARIYAQHPFDLLGPDIVSVFSGIHQSPKTLHGCTLESVRHKRACVARSKNPILLLLSSGEKNSPAIWRLVQIRNRKKQHIDTTRPAEGVVLHGSCVIFSQRYLARHPEPFYPNYSTFVTLTGATIRPITTTPEENYKFAIRERVEACINEHTRAILFTNPGNPTGTILTEEELKLMADIAKEHNLFIIGDEVYREFVYGGEKLMSLLQLEGYEDNVVVIDSVSKRFSACGARIGCVITRNAELYNNAMKWCQGRLCASTIDQVASAALYTVGPEYFDAVRKEYKARRDTLVEGLKKIPGVIYSEPKGAFYVMAKLPVDDAEKFQLFMLEEFDDNGDTLMFTPAESFYKTPHTGVNEIRMAYVINQDALKRSMELLAKGIEAYNNK